MPSTLHLLMVAVALAAGCGGSSAGAPVKVDAQSERFDGGCADFTYDGGTVSECRGPERVDAASCAAAFKPAGESRCTVTSTSVDCAVTISTLGGRQVYWQVPQGTSPAHGWPVVIVFQGSLFGPDVSWSGGTGLPFGGLNQIRLQALLLDNGFAVIAPTTSNGAYWLTNFPGYDASADNTFMLALLADIAAGKTFGPIDSKRLYATGISSGGFMTSRMAVSYPGHFAALAIESGGYATCPALCSSPLPALPADHPPTLFLHGGQDPVVAPSYARSYYDDLIARGIEGEIIIDPAAGHQWLDVAPQAVTCWFLSH
jgi:poly(3-hydroxybutyrate) depolymerase